MEAGWRSVEPREAKTESTSVTPSVLFLHNLLSFVSEGEVNHLRAESLGPVSELTVWLPCPRFPRFVEVGVSLASSLTLLQEGFRVHRDPTCRPRRCGTSTAAADAVQMTRYQTITGYHGVLSRHASCRSLKLPETSACSWSTDRVGIVG